ncbi:GNAT family N-acetyltransferase [Nocardia callitridis]|uniref:GNAT family N-acetyltransferase n=1 Tax=Nocardia callitridis TaxID=648753 RepID=A0ABP9JQZ7_9NOCA
MRIEITTDPAEFRSRAEPFLLRDLLRHTVISTRVADHLAGIDARPAPCHYLTVHVEDAQSPVIGVAMRVEGNDVYLGELPDGSLAAVAEALAEVAPDSGGVEGAMSAATEFAEHWYRLVGKDFRYRYTVRLYRLGVLRVPHATGAARQVTRADIALCAQWLTDMYGHQIAPSSIARRVDAGRWWLWERDGRPVGLAAHQIPSNGWSRIGPVYTPPSERGRGVASALSAHVAGLLRAEGLDVCLFADTATPTAHKIYQSIGFHPTHEFVRHQFVGRAAR